MDDDLFTYEVKVANIPCDSKMDDDSEHEADDDMGYDPSDVAFIEWLGSKIFNYKTMDHYTMKALWIYWIRGDDEVELTDEESDDEDEIAEVFRIDTNIFDYETPLCSAFNEFTTFSKTYPGSMRSYGLTLEFGPNPHQLNILANLSTIRLDVWNGQHVDYEWYEAMEHNKLKDEALRNKAIMEGLINEDNDESRYEQKRQWNMYTNYDDAYEINHRNNEKEELCKVYELPACNIRRYMMIKYLFNNDEEYVAVKEEEYDNITITRKEACQAYQEIFWIMDEGWMDLAFPFPNVYLNSTKYECAGDVVDFRTWLGISLETTMMSTMDLDGVTCLNCCPVGVVLLVKDCRMINRDLDNSTSNVLIPLDSWTSGLLVYKLPLSEVEYRLLKSPPFRYSRSNGYGLPSGLCQSGRSVVALEHSLRWTNAEKLNKVSVSSSNEVLELRVGGRSGFLNQSALSDDLLSSRLDVKVPLVFRLGFTKNNDAFFVTISSIVTIYSLL
ncbi:hypothetical protein Tco_0369304 [Tanacetum coccineum]